jgi:hypothetical protein
LTGSITISTPACSAAQRLQPVGDARARDDRIRLVAAQPLQQADHEQRAKALRDRQIRGEPLDRAPADVGIGRGEAETVGVGLAGHEGGQGELLLLKPAGETVEIDARRIGQLQLRAVIAKLAE